MKRFLILLMTFLPFAAIAHGDAMWIQNNKKYIQKAPSTTHCCGPTDCRMASRDEFLYIPDGWRVIRNGVAEDILWEFNTQGTYDSENNHFWLCENMQYSDSLKKSVLTTICVFIPNSGT